MAAGAHSLSGIRWTGGGFSIKLQFMVLNARFILKLARVAGVVAPMVVACATVHAASISAVPSPERPNIVLILADDLGYGDLGCYGQSRIKTPNLDKMAAEGMRFTQFYSGSTVCAPSRCAMMTGLHTGHALIRGNAKVPLGAGDRTVARTLQESGYYTALIGKWGLGDYETSGAPQRQGFKEFLGYLDQRHAHDYYTTHLFRVDPANDYSGQIDFPENAGGKKAVYTHDLFSEAALRFLKIHAPGAYPASKPFFLFLAYTIPHANNEEGARTGDGMEVPSRAPYEFETWPGPEKGKAAMITRMDRDIGRFFDRLKELKLEDRTLVIFTSDNGPHREGGVKPEFFKSSGPLRGIKRDLYEGGIRVPMIVRWPGKVKSGQVSDVAWAQWDLPATLASVAGITNAPAGDGLSFLPAILGQAQTNRHDYFYWEFHERGFTQAVRTGDWKGIRKEGAPFELYDLKADIGEEKNLADKHPEMVGKLEAVMKSARTPSSHWPGPKGS